VQLVYLMYATWHMRVHQEARKSGRLADAHAPTRLHTVLEEGSDERIKQVDDSIDGATAIQHCPFCGVYEHTGHNVCCLYCRGFLSEELLEALRRLPDLPGILPSSSPGTHASGASIGRIDASSSISASQPRVSVRDADSRVYGVA
jgi:hypothetical protein